jgi:hypothetical protein
MSMRFVNCSNITTTRLATLPSRNSARDYLLYGKNVKKWDRAVTVALCGIKFFYENTIKHPWPTLLFIRPGHEMKLPVVLSRMKFVKL